MPESLSVYHEIALILLIAVGVGAIGALLRQPLIVAFIAVGILVGPAGFNLVTHDEEIEFLASMGISILLFLVGLRLDLNVIRTMGPVSLATGLGQVAFTSIIGYFICLALGLSHVTSMYVAVALTFSSTIIIVKLLSDKREIDSLHGRIAVGFLIVQDMVVVIAMIVLSAIGAGASSDSAWAQIGLVLVKGIAMLAVVAALMRWVFPKLLHVMARYQELLMLAGIAWAVTLSAGGELMGFSKEVGAFLAGVSLASTPFRDALGGRLVGIRDFLLLFFFIHLGASLDLNLIGAQVGPAVVLSLFVLIGNPLIVLVIMGAMGYRRRTSFLAGLTVAQISEFSLILGALGITLGHLEPEALGLITLVGLITICLSTYMILYSHQLYERVQWSLRPFERAVPHREVGYLDKKAVGCGVILFGLGRFGYNIAKSLRERNVEVLGVDFDPQVIAEWRARGWPAQYGDAEDPEFAATLPLSDANWVVSTMPQMHINRALLAALREQHYRGRIALTAHNHHDAHLLQRTGADLVLLPFVDAAQQAVDLITGAEADLRGDRECSPDRQSSIDPQSV